MRAVRCKAYFTCQYRLLNAVKIYIIVNYKSPAVDKPLAFSKLKQFQEELVNGTNSPMAAYRILIINCKDSR